MINNKDVEETKGSFCFMCRKKCKDGKILMSEFLCDGRIGAFENGGMFKVISICLSCWRKNVGNKLMFEK